VFSRVKLCIALRHAESTYNVAGRANGDPDVAVPLSDRGVRRTRMLAAQLRNVSIDAAVYTRFERTAATARLALDRPDVLMVCEPLLDDIGCGAFEGAPVTDEHAWRAARPRSARPRGGESIIEATRRIGRGLRQVAQRDERVVLLVTHELAMRYLINAASDSDDIASPHREIRNAMPFLFSVDSVERAASRIEDAATGAWVTVAAGKVANGG
jgi:broad specificity phosphatase PhoE